MNCPVPAVRKPFCAWLSELHFSYSHCQLRAVPLAQGCKPGQERKLQILWDAKAWCLIMQMGWYSPHFHPFNFISRPSSHTGKAQYKLRPSQAKQKRLRFLSSSLSDGWGSKIKPTTLNSGCLNDLQVQHWTAKISLLSSRLPRYHWAVTLSRLQHQTQIMSDFFLHFLPALGGSILISEVDYPITISAGHRPRKKKKPVVCLAV